MQYRSIDWFVLGFVTGYFGYPLWLTVKTIFINAWKSSSACTGDCNQGRNCNCRGK